MSIQSMASDDAVVHGAAVMVAPAAIGCAAGVLLSGGLGEGARRFAAVALLTVGVAAAAPLIAEILSRRTESGQRQRRRMIRDGALPAGVGIYELDELDELIESAALEER